MPGRVKTRLIGPLSATQAAALHLCCVGDATTLVRAAADCLSGPGKFFFLAPPARRTSASRLPLRVAFDPEWTVVKQRGPDLGARMRNAIAVLLRSGAEKVVIIGTDTPWMGAERIVRAVRSLDRTDIVLGPTEDGGYYLLGARRAVPEMFEGIPWGTPRVLVRTTRALQRAGVTCRLLPRDFDLDRPDDLQRAARLLRRHPSRAPALARFLQRLKTN